MMMMVEKLSKNSVRGEEEEPQHTGPRKRAWRKVPLKEALVSIWRLCFEAPCPLGGGRAQPRPLRHLLMILLLRGWPNHPYP